MGGLLGGEPPFLCRAGLTAVSIAFRTPIFDTAGLNLRHLTYRYRMSANR
jgi:hypothetical protein